jgi:hypothetical protein
MRSLLQAELYVMELFLDDRIAGFQGQGFLPRLTRLLQTLQPKVDVTQVLLDYRVIRHRGNSAF